MEQDHTQRLMRTFVDLSDTLVNHYDVHDFASRLCERCVELLDVSAAGVLLTNGRGELELLATSSEDVRALELFQLQSREGPCFDSYRQGQRVAAPDLRETDGHWPAFRRRAADVGFRAVHAFPMRLRDRTIGALNLLNERPGALRDDDTDIAQALADITTIGVLQHRTVDEARTLAGQLQYALESRVAIEQAKGIVAEQAGVDIGAAFDRLRRYARVRNLRLRDVAARVVAGSLDAERLTEPPQAKSRVG